ncbi:MAG TPA: membrane dipeptidase [Burkholderiales bacterium]|jgi:membrane dipeptidase|nr:membrane dipeptidase [Burkholderiales bacterium]
MKRRDFLRASAALGAGAIGIPGAVQAQTRAPRFCDMHAHMGGFRQTTPSFREAMAAGDLLLVAEKVTPDSPILRLVGSRLASIREAAPGELRKYFEDGLQRRRQRIRADRLAEVASAETLDRVLAEKTPAIAVSAEGADFLEGDLRYLEHARAQGLVHLQLVHYYTQSLIGDISTQEPRHGGLSAHGKDLVRECNRLKILVDVAHCSNLAMEQALDISTKPLVYSHGHISAEAPRPSQAGSIARAIHLPVARRIAERGGVVGLWPNGLVFANLDLYADELMRMVKVLGVAHTGVGSDLNGITRTIMPTYAQFAALEGALEQRGLAAKDISAVLGGNYVRVLRESLN